MIWGQALKNWAQLGGFLGKSAWAGMGASGRATALGGLAGAGWGMVSDDTSVIGGAMMGAAAGRYGSAFGRGMMSRWNTAAGAFAGGSYSQGFATLGRSGGSALRSALFTDIRSAGVRANRAFNSIGSTLKGWNR